MHFSVHWYMSKSCGICMQFQHYKAIQFHYPYLQIVSQILNNNNIEQRTILPNLWQPWTFLSHLTTILPHQIQQHCVIAWTNYLYYTLQKQQKNRRAVWLPFPRFRTNDNNSSKSLTFLHNLTVTEDPRESLAILPLFASLLFQPKGSV